MAFHSRVLVGATLAPTLVLLGLATSPVMAQQSGLVLGNITDGRDGRPIAGAEVALQSTLHRTVSDAVGHFELTGVRSGNYTLVVRRAGYATRRYNSTVQDGATVNVTLEPIVLPIQNVTTAGFLEPTWPLGLPFASGRADGGQLQAPTGGSIMAALAGKIAGVHVLGTSGQLGSGMSLRLRAQPLGEGATPLPPLFIVDDIIQWGRTADELDIDPAEIESIEVLKGAASAALYGSRGANGVISIRTKRATAGLGETRIDYRMEAALDDVGRQMPLSRHHPYLLSPDGRSFVDSAGRSVSWAQRSLDPNRFADNEYPSPLFDNVRTLLPPTAGFRQSAALSRNSKNSALVLALKRVDQGGAMPGNDGLWRNQGRLNIDYMVGDRLIVALDGTHSQTWQDDMTSPFHVAQITPPIIDFARKGPDNQYVQVPDSGVFVVNPLWREQATTTISDMERSRVSARALYNPNPWLSLEGLYGYNRIHNEARTEFMQDPSRLNGEYIDGRYAFWEAAFGATVRRRVGALDLQSRVSGNVSRENFENVESAASRFLPDPQQTVFDSSFTRSEVRYRSFGLDMRADYADRFAIDGSVRRDRNNLWGPDAGWQLHYRAGAAYRIDAGRWFGPAANDLIVRYAVGAIESTTDVLPGISGPAPGSPSLRPPRTREHELGVAAVLLNRRLSMEAAYSRVSIRDQMVRFPLPPIYGYGTAAGNLGAETGQAFEATLQARLLNSRDLTIDLAAVADRTSNQITEWPRACYYGDYGYVCGGQQRGDVWGVRYLHSAAELPPWLRDRATEFQVNDEGYLVWVGSGNTIRDGNAKQLWNTFFEANGRRHYWGEPIFRLSDDGLNYVYSKLGSSLPELGYGFNTVLRWKVVSLLAEMRGQLGGHVYNRGKEELYRSLRHADVDQAGRSDELKKPVDYYYRLAGLSFMTERFVEDATYLKVGALSARFHLERQHLAGLFGSKAPRGITLGLTARNLFTATGYSGFDPEAGTPIRRMESLEYPPLRSLAATVDITF
jgi:TonB-dependent SusC/RagA subfamily outer membrane receptor